MAFISTPSTSNQGRGRRRHRRPSEAGEELQRESLSVPPLLDEGTRACLAQPCIKRDRCESGLVIDGIFLVGVRFSRQETPKAEHQRLFKTSVDSLRLPTALEDFLDDHPVLCEILLSPLDEKIRWTVPGCLRRL